MGFPYGRAPLAILLLALAAAGGIAYSAGEEGKRPDLVFAIFAREHVDAYKDAIAEFEREHGVTVRLELVDQKPLKERLQASMQAGADVPDMVELLDGTMGTFTQGPLADVQLRDLTERVEREGFHQKLVDSRFAKWTSRGHIFAMPHDVHPVMLCYRTDICRELGIDIPSLTTWDKFAAVGREIVAKSQGADGNPKHYMIDLQGDGSDNLRLLFLQAGGQYFGEDGRVAFDSAIGEKVVNWYVHQTEGATRTSFPAGWGQNFDKAVTDGLVLFVLTPDWRTKSFQIDMQSLSGKFGLMALPAWEEGGRRTSTWGGTGLAFPKAGRNFELAWELGKKLYYDTSGNGLGKRYEGNNILPPVKAAWSQPEFHAPRAFFGGLVLGEAYQSVAEGLPEERSCSFSDMARDKMGEAFTNASLYYRDRGEAGLEGVIREQLKERADDVRRAMAHNVFLAAGGGQ